MRLLFPLLLLAAAFAGCSTAALADTMPLSELDLGNVQQDYGSPGKNLSLDKKPITLGGQVFPSGLGTHANSSLLIDLKQARKRITATVGVDDEVKNRMPVWNLSSSVIKKRSGKAGC